VAARSEPQSAPQTVSKVQRSSPPVSTRRNELAEALSGLESSNQRTASAEYQDESAIAPPAAEGADDLPSYLRESKPVTKSRPSQKSLDLRDALLSDEPIHEAAQAPAGKPADRLAPRMPSTSSPKAAPPKTAAETPAGEPLQAKISPVKPPAKAPTSEETDGLGSLDAQDASAMFGAEGSELSAPAPVKASKAATASKVASGAAASTARGLLFTSKQPLITSHIEGPQRIVVGRQAEYRVTIENKGDVTAREVAAVVAAPTGTEVVDATASNGTVERDGKAAADGQF
jgi:uncharacterized repeat protein (TIGR01451 family)